MIQFMQTLYGDGIHDDLPAIQEQLDSGASCVYLPAPKNNYLISGTIRVHSNQMLKLDRYTRIVLAPNSNCLMLTVGANGEHCTNVHISGGIWDMNHSKQKPNPWHFPDPDTGKTAYDLMAERGFRSAIQLVTEEQAIRKVPGLDFPEDIYTGHCMFFQTVKNLYVGNLSIVNPVVYGMDLFHVSDFTVENIDFQYTEGSPKLWNMDGVHVEGYCKNGYIRNLKGACHDDTVALTSDDVFRNGPIENITVDGIYGDNSHSAVRLLSRVYPVRNVHISNIYGSYYAYGVVLSKYSVLPERSGFENISIDHVHASLCPGTVDVAGNKRPLIWIGEQIDIKNLRISDLCRTETHNPNPTIGIDAGSYIDRLSVSNCTQVNKTGSLMPFLHNEGTIDKVYLYNVDTAEDTLLAGDGAIHSKTII